MAKISIATVRALVNFLSKLSNSSPLQLKGVSRAQLLAEINLSEFELNQSIRVIDSTKYEALFSLAERTLQNKSIGFDFGKVISIDRWGILSYIAFTSPTLKVALAKQRKYQALAGNLGTPFSELIGDNLLLKWIPAQHCSHHIVEEIITGWATLAMNLSQNNIKANAIYFQHDLKENDNSKVYESYFGCPVYFEHDFNGIQIEQKLLEIPLITVDNTINHALCNQADEVLSNIIKQSPIETVNQFIINQLPLGLPEIDDAAKQLGLSIRTLQRKLSDNHLTFSSMIDNIRKELACSYLSNTNTKVIYITQMLGFSEQSAFQRAFKRWTEQTPKQYRDSHTQVQE